jgi:hypothetical protein
MGRAGGKHDQPVETEATLASHLSSATRKSLVERIAQPMDARSSISAAKRLRCSPASVVAKPLAISTEHKLKRRRRADRRFGARERRPIAGYWQRIVGRLSSARSSDQHAAEDVDQLSSAAMRMPRRRHPRQAVAIPAIDSRKKIDAGEFLEPRQPPAAPARRRAGGAVAKQPAGAGGPFAVGEQRQVAMTASMTSARYYRPW